MFRRTAENPEARVSLIVDGREISAQTGETLAAALLAADITIFRRSAVSGTPRGPFCLMGACFECQVTIEGARQRACMTLVADGMRIETDEGRRRIAP